jgi:adenylate kinase family enzyme
MSKILLSGVPGTGKSTLADYLENNLGLFSFRHGAK